MTVESDFSQRPLLAGAVTGQRAWRMINGRLTGIHFMATWAPGENTAECLSPFWSHDFDEFTCKHPESQIATRACRCGFFAYFDGGDNPHRYEYCIAGLVEGYGRMVVGDRGFRSLKARIVALIEPESAPASLQFAMRAPEYRSIPVYPDFEAAYVDHPLTPIDLSTLPKPTD